MIIKLYAPGCNINIVYQPLEVCDAELSTSLAYSTINSLKNLVTWDYHKIVRLCTQCRELPPKLHLDISTTALNCWPSLLITVVAIGCFVSILRT